MITLSAFADELSDSLDEQIAVLRSEEIAHVELRSVRGTNVLDLSDQEAGEIKTVLDSNGLRISSIASPIGKVPIDTPLDIEIERLERAVALCDVFETRSVRIFSFYPREGDMLEEEFRSEVLIYLQALVDAAATNDITLLHENDVDLYGDSVSRCRDILDTIRDPHLAAILDPANYILAGEVPYPQGYEAVKARLKMVHVKDARDGHVVAAGEGNGNVPELIERLKLDRFEGVLALEPHLQSAGRFQGYSGPALFRHAVSALKQLLIAADLSWK